MTHTPTPWEQGTQHPAEVFSSEDCHRIADCTNNRRPEDVQQANAAYLVRCVNNHAQLLRALKDFRLYFEITPFVEELSSPHMAAIYVTWCQAKDIIAKAEGRTP